MTPDRASRALVAVVALVAATATVAQAFPAVAAALEYDRAALARGEPWRAVSGHLVHASVEHWLLDLAVFVACALAAPPRAALRALALAAVAIPAALWLLLPELARYRGLSGLDAALVAVLAADAIRRRRQSGESRRLAAVAALVLVGLGAKTVYEMVSGAAFFLGSEGAGFVPVPLAHAVGGLCGVMVAPPPQAGQSQAKAAPVTRQ